MKWQGWVLALAVAVAMGCAFTYATSAKLQVGLGQANAEARKGPRQVRSLEVVLLPTGVIGAQLVYVAVAEDGTIWQRVGVGGWEQQPSLPKP